MQNNISFEDFYKSYCKVLINGVPTEMTGLTDYQKTFAHWLENQTEPFTLIPTRIRTYDKSYEIWKELMENSQ